MAVGRLLKRLFFFFRQALKALAFDFAQDAIHLGLQIIGSLIG